MRTKEGAERTIILANDKTSGPLQLSIEAFATGEQEGSSQQVADSLPPASTVRGQKSTEEMSAEGSIATHRAGVLPRSRPG